MDFWNFKPPSDTEFENLSEIQCEKWFSSLGIQIEQVSRGKERTPDYRIPEENIGIEHSVMWFFKDVEPLQNLLSQLPSKIGTVQHIKLTADKIGSMVDIKYVNEFKTNDEIALLIIESDLSGVKKKSWNKLKNEMKHFKDGNYKKYLIVLDHRYFMFDSESLVGIWEQILNQKGKNHKKLLGIMLATLKAPEDSENDLPHLQFVKNPHSPFVYPKELEAIEKTEKSQFVVKSVHILGEISPSIKSPIDIGSYLKKCGLNFEIARFHHITASKPVHIDKH
ncbi:MAG: hypothetical protein OI715_00495 (plasmid) [Candidatus Methanoperedens sp.]|nr:MAG: hypothetical protein OI715_00495 [Candidatus Methanoperedens sp.]